MSSKKIKQKVQIVVSTKDSVLLLQLTKERGSFWQNATGAVEENELFIEAAKRELYEETGIKNEVIELPMEIRFHDRWGRDVIEKVFHCYVNVEVEILLSDEHQSYKWISKKILAKKDFGYLNHFQAAILAGEHRE